MLTEHQGLNLMQLLNIKRKNQRGNIKFPLKSFWFSRAVTFYLVDFVKEPLFIKIIG